MTRKLINSQSNRFAGAVLIATAVLLSETLVPSASAQEAIATGAPAEAPVSDAEAAAATAEAPNGSASAADGSRTGPAKEAEEKPPEIKLPPPPPARPDEIPIELVPYNVDLAIVFESTPRLGVAFQTQVLAEIASRARRDIGQMWRIDFSSPDWLTPRNRAGVERLTSAQIKRRLVEEKLDTVVREQLSAHSASKEKLFPPDPDSKLSDERRALVGRILDETDREKQDVMVRQYVELLADERVVAEGRETASEVVSLYLLPPEVDRDKIFPIAIETDGSDYVISGREWDRESEVFSRTQSRRTTDRRAVATEVIRLLEDLFHPIAQIDGADPTTATLRIKASEYPSADPGFNQVQKGSAFIPFFRYMNRYRVMQKLQFLPWSYITVEEKGRIRSQCRLDTGVKTPLGSFRRRRMELRALMIKPEQDQTTLTVVPRTNVNRPLVGYLVAVYDELPPPPAKPGGDEQEKLDASLAGEKKVEGPKPVIYRTDRSGQVTIPRNPKTPLQWVFVRSGAALLTRFPLIPGVEPGMTAECPDDTIRLDVEGQMVLLQSRLIDTIAKRAMVQAMIKGRAAKSEWEKVDESLVELDELPSIKDFDDMVEQIQFSAIKSAQARKDIVSERRIKTLGKDILKVASIHLDETKLNEFRDEIEDQRRLDGAAPTGGPRKPAARR